MSNTRKQVVLRPTIEQHQELTKVHKSEEPTLSFNSWAVRKLLVSTRKTAGTSAPTKVPVPLVTE